MVAGVLKILLIDPELTFQLFSPNLLGWLNGLSTKQSSDCYHDEGNNRTPPSFICKLD